MSNMDRTCVECNLYFPTPRHYRAHRYYDHKDSSRPGRPPSKKLLVEGTPLPERGRRQQVNSEPSPAATAVPNTYELLMSHAELSMLYDLVLTSVRQGKATGESMADGTQTTNGALLIRLTELLVL